MLLINFALQSKVCQVLFNCGDRDMQISELICFISSLSMLGVFYQRSILKFFSDFNFGLSQAKRDGMSKMNLELNTLNDTRLKALTSCLQVKIALSPD